MEPAFLGDFGWRSSRIFGVLRMRPPIAHHSVAEGELLERTAHGARTIVEIGVAEGGSAWHLRRAIDPGGTLYLVDPYRRLLGFNPTIVIARRLVGSVDRAEVVWIRDRSERVSPSWDKPIEFLFIDGDHAYESVQRDFEEWSPHVVEDGAIAFHDALVAAPWMSPGYGSAQFVKDLLESDRGWKLADRADSTAVLRRG